MSIKTKILVPMLILTVLVAAGILVSNIMLFSNYVDESMLDKVVIASDVAANYFESLKGQSQTASEYMSQSPDIIEAVKEAVKSGDRDSLISNARQLQRDTGVEFCTITDAEGNVILRTHEPDNYGDSVLSQSNIRSAIAGQSLMAVERGTAVRLSVRSGSPVFDEQGDVIGAVSVGYRMDTELFVDELKRLLSCEVTVFLDDERVSTTVTNEDGTRAIGTTASESVSQTVLAGGVYFGRASILDRAAVTKYIPIMGPDGKAIGMLFVGHYIDDATAVMWAFVQTGLIITLILLVISVLIVLAVARLIVKPLQALTVDAEAIATGDIDIEGLDSGTTPTHNEIIKLERAFSHMLDSFKKQAYILARVAEGDYTAKVDIRSEKDVINLAIELVLDSTLGVLQQVASAGVQVSDGAKQIADGAQVLAQGSTEQAAVVQQLSASIAEIAQKTKDNAGMAGRAASLANKIKQNAEKGSHQMSDMMSAAKDINLASQNISKVISVIDSIAFQTNILALNAAVEAARAGQHGKGFAVVAEEVRNLAAKSAEAAKDTGELISNSIEKAELGSRIASETAASLAEIVAGINESAQIISDIATSSDDQSRNITEINKGIDQVAQVVQQNSATAEESAAASEEMSGQSAVLEELIKQFQLRGNVSRPRGLPPSR